MTPAREPGKAEPQVPPPALEYRAPAPPTTKPAALTDLVFWVVYAVAALVGVGVFNEPLHISLYGRPGDSGMLCCFALGAVFTTIALAFCYANWLRRLPWRLALAPAVGLASPGPGYLIAILASG